MGRRRLGECRVKRGEIRWYTFRLPDKRRPVWILTKRSHRPTERDHGERLLHVYGEQMLDDERFAGTLNTLPTCMPNHRAHQNAKEFLIRLLVLRQL